MVDNFRASGFQANDLIGPDKPWLAPLAGYSDLAFRLLCRRRGAAVAVTEMVSAKGLVYGGSGSTDLLVTCAEDNPLVVQLFGAEPEFLRRAVGLLRERGFTLFDLNCGCSVRKVVKTGAGAALLADADRLVSCAQAMVETAGSGLVGVKLRLGVCADAVVVHDVGKRLEQAGAAWLTLHPRTAKQGFSGCAAHDELERLKEAVSLPVMASGDLFSPEDGLRVLRESSVDGVMFARGALRDPSIFNGYLRLLSGKPLQPFDKAGVRAAIREHAELCREHSDGRALLKMRTIAPRYVKGMAGASRLRGELTKIGDWETFEELMDEFFSEKNTSSLAGMTD